MNSNLKLLVNCLALVLMLQTLSAKADTLPVRTKVKQLNCDGLKTHQFTGFEIADNEESTRLTYNYSTGIMLCPSYLISSNLEMGKSTLCQGVWSYTAREAQRIAADEPLQVLLIPQMKNGKLFQVIARYKTNKVYGSKPIQIVCEIIKVEI